MHFHAKYTLFSYTDLEFTDAILWQIMEKNLHLRYETEVARQSDIFIADSYNK